ncbi:hypothetical protein [Vibrio tubiashii]|uniref:hypothetical protein n=1 Tax=Vibrio tubiashii TaxID=29498 RepID=UPI0002F01573|nr:hypothetical protein [Vibrio tubiashii]
MCWLVRFGAYGIDFTDESFYLLWIDAPNRYSWPASQFGFIYHPVYNWLGGDVAALRRFNIISIFALAWILCAILLTSLEPRLKENRIYSLTISAGLACSALILFDAWLSTPNYNSLNLKALLVVSIGLVLANNTMRCSSVFGWFLVSVGGWLAFMAKPTTALALAFGVLIYLVAARRFSIKFLLFSLICAISLLIMSALLFDGSISGFIERLQLATEFSLLQEGGYSTFEMLRIDSFNLNVKLQAIIVTLSLILFFTLYSLWGGKLLFGSFISLLFFVITGLLTLGFIHQSAEFGGSQGLLMLAVTGAMLVFVAVTGGSRLKMISRQQWAIAAFFLISPHIYAFGTNGNYWELGSWAAIFWVLAGLVILIPIIRERNLWVVLIAISLCVQSVTAALLHSGIESPYRQPQPLRLNSSSLELGPLKSEFVLSNGYANYMSSVMSVFDKAGFESNMPIIDLTGQSPGIVFAVGGESIGQAWLIGGYSGSVNFTEAAFSITTCEKISKAWILHEPQGPRSISANVMQSFGSEFAEDYKKVGSWKVADGAGGYQTRPLQELYKPIDPKEIMKNCQMLRQVE